MTGSWAAEADIEIGHHDTVEILGFTIHADTVATTALSGLIVIALGLWVRSKMTSGVPSKIQVFWEAIVDAITRQVEASLGRVNRTVVSLAIALFVFILVANWLEIIPSNHLLVPPTADVNLTYALALLVIVGVHVHSIRQRGLKGYVKHYFEPYPILFPIEFLQELIKPFTLALRLFGNIFSSGIMLTLIALLPVWVMWGPNAIWKLFAMFVGVIQAFIFALLAILYFGMAGETHEEGEHPPAGAPAAKQPTETEQELGPAGTLAGARS